jgi:magnesium-transporting ATPase (P-type)
MQTELGRIAKSLDDRTNGKTQLQKQLERLAMGLFVLALILGGVVIAVNNFT